MISYQNLGVNLGFKVGPIWLKVGVKKKCLMKTAQASKENADFYLMG